MSNDADRPRSRSFTGSEFMRRVARIDIETFPRCRARWHGVRTTAADPIALRQVPPVRPTSPTARGAIAAMPAGP